MKVPRGPATVIGVGALPEASAATAESQETCRTRFAGHCLEEKGEVGWIVGYTSHLPFEPC